MTARDQERLGLAAFLFLAWLCVVGVSRCVPLDEPAPAAARAR